MHASATFKRLCLGATATAAFLLPSGAKAQGSDKWVASIQQLSIGGAADLTVEKRNDKQSRAKITFRNTKSNIMLAWDIAIGVCRDEGPPLAPPAAFTPAQTTMDGGGTISSNVPKLESGKSYYVRVYDPQTAVTDRSAYGCAVLSEKP